MNYVIHTKGLELGSAVREELTSRVELTLQRFPQEVANVHISLEAVNAHRGGRNARCVITVTLRHTETPLIASARHTRIEGAVSQAAREIARLLSEGSDEHSPHRERLAAF